VLGGSIEHLEIERWGGCMGEGETYSLQNELRNLGKHLVEPLSLFIVAVVVALASLGWKNFAESFPRAVLIVMGFLLLMFVLLTVSNLRSDISKVSDRIDKLQSIAPWITYYDTHGSSRDSLFEEITRIVSGAQRDILALNWYGEERDQDLPARDRYFSVLIEKASSLEYKRLIQSASYDRANGAPPISQEFEESYVNHFKAMIATQREQKKAGKFRIELMVVPPYVPSTFLIVDGKYLVWQLNELAHHDSREQWKIRGAIIVHDQGGRFIEHFVDTFKRAHHGGRAVIDSDLF
jgi:hypothetical protein